MRLACNNIMATAATQVRTELNKDVIDHYREDLENGAEFPPVDVFAEKGSEQYILADGFHRLFAHVHAEIDEIEVTLHEGNLHDALMFALGANVEHGLRRSNADKINAVELALKDPQISRLSQQEIADICRVSRETVNRVGRRGALTDPPDNSNVEKKKPEDNKPENNRTTRPEPTQEEIERDELREALRVIRAFPYPGEDAGKLELSKEDGKDLLYVSSWCFDAVQVCGE